MDQQQWQRFFRLSFGVYKDLGVEDVIVRPTMPVLHTASMAEVFVQPVHDDAYSAHLHQWGQGNGEGLVSSAPVHDDAYSAHLHQWGQSNGEGFCACYLMYTRLGL